MFERVIAVLTLLINAIGLTFTLATYHPPADLPAAPAPLYGVVSRKPRNFRQPINMACLALGR